VKYLGENGTKKVFVNREVIGYVCGVSGIPYMDIYIYLYTAILSYIQAYRAI